MVASIPQNSAKYLQIMMTLNLNFQVKGHSFTNGLFYILIILRKCFVFQFLTRGIRMYFPILTGVENGCFTS